MDKPTKTDASIGRAKADRPAPFPQTPDLRYEVPAAEYERVKDAILALADSLLWDDGWSFSDEFREVDSSWTQTETGGGTVSVLDAVDATGGVGVVQLESGTGSGDRGRIYQAAQIINADMNPRFRARALFSGTASHCNLIVGLAVNGGTAMAAFTRTGNNWQCSVASDVGASSATADSGIAITDGQWYLLEIQIDNGSACRFYIDSVLVHTFTVAGTFPVDEDELTVMLDCARASSTGGDLWIDFFTCRGDRV